ncbi:MAG: hypothetical protein LLG13_18165 [Bacteroidales bacterium]|nr:hypothetical protein [Bacteroidales bacterium]
MNVYILDIKKDRLIKAEIVIAGKKGIPLKRDGWNFNWEQLVREKNSKTFLLKTSGPEGSVEGAMHLKIENEMLIMDILEIAPHNVGQKDKRYDYVAGCLIAFACRESFKLEGDYKGFLTFVSKTNLIKWYADKYDAKVALGQRMFIDDEAGKNLINEYLERK